MKPRLKLTVNGGVQRFAERFGFRYEACSRALNPHYGHKCAGEPEQIRQMLGLFTAPTNMSRKFVAVHAALRARRTVA